MYPSPKGSLDCLLSSLIGPRRPESFRTPINRSRNWMRSGLGALEVGTKSNCGLNTALHFAFPSVFRSPSSAKTSFSSLIFS